MSKPEFEDPRPGCNCKDRSTPCHRLSGEHAEDCPRHIALKEWQKQQDAVKAEQRKAAAAEKALEREAKRRRA